jgi:23S rRNA (pseudouridine1915-N3)-methyltransferase
MTQLTVISVGTLKEDYLTAAVREYEKRLSAFCRVESITLREERIRDEEDATAVRAALEAEGERILSRIPEGAYTVALCVEGREMSSEELAEVLGKASDRTGKLCLLIGSSHGLSPTVKARADLRLSIGRLTYPHQLVRVLLHEILYRSFSILAGKKYHK